MERFIIILKKPRGFSTLYTDNEQAFEATIINWYFDSIYRIYYYSIYSNPLEQRMTAKLEG